MPWNRMRRQEHFLAQLLLRRQINSPSPTACQIPSLQSLQSFRPKNFVLGRIWLKDWSTRCTINVPHSPLGLRFPPEYASKINPQLHIVFLTDFWTFYFLWFFWSIHQNFSPLSTFFEMLIFSSRILSFYLIKRQSIKFRLKESKCRESGRIKTFIQKIPNSSLFSYKKLCVGKSVSNCSKSFQFLNKIFIFEQNFYFWTIFEQNFNFWAIFLFLSSKNLEQNFYFWTKFLFLNKIFIFEQNFYF